MYGNAPGSKIVTVPYGEKYSLTADDLPVIYNDIYDFVGWSTQRFMGERITIGYQIEGNITLHAVWLHKAKITYHSEKGKVPSPKNINLYSDYFFESSIGFESLPVLEAEGFVFKGWSYDKDKEEFFEGGIISSDVDLYAIWEEIPKEVEPVNYVDFLVNPKYCKYPLQGFLGWLLVKNTIGGTE
jgi:hypothetical protein